MPTLGNFCDHEALLDDTEFGDVSKERSRESPLDGGSAGPAGLMPDLAVLVGALTPGDRKTGEDLK